MEIINLNNVEYDELDIVDIKNSNNYTMDMEVEDTHYYTLENGVVSHNSVSLMTQTSSGIEPVFMPVYRRRRKINPNDKDVKVAFVDEVGDSWEEYNVSHPKFEDWMTINGYDASELKNMKDADIDELVKKSPYFEATSNDVDWLEKVRMQGEIQKWVDHSISVTVNLPKDVTEDLVSDVYETGWKYGCKGITVYRDGSRAGVLISKTEQSPNVFAENHAPKRPKKLKCDVVRFQNKGEKWIGFLGLMDNRPYEIFTGIADAVSIPTNIEEGEIVKVNKKEGDTNSRYDFHFIDKDGYKQEFNGLSRAFNRDFWNTGKAISAVLRHGMPLQNVMSFIDSLDFVDGESIVHWKSGVKRIIKKYIKDGTKVGKTCPECGGDIIFIEGCETCSSCSYTKCG